jgi:hypothetical protein
MPRLRSDRLRLLTDVARFHPETERSAIPVSNLYAHPGIVEIRAKIGSTRIEIAAVRVLIVPVRARIGPHRIKSDHIVQF